MLLDTKSYLEHSKKLELCTASHKNLFENTNYEWSGRKVTEYTEKNNKLGMELLMENSTESTDKSHMFDKH